VTLQREVPPYETDTASTKRGAWTSAGSPGAGFSSSSSARSHRRPPLRWAITPIRRRESPSPTSTSRRAGSGSAGPSRSETRVLGGPTRTSHHTASSSDRGPASATTHVANVARSDRCPMSSLHLRSSTARRGPQRCWHARGSCSGDGQ
jgi:hypothetical protein